MFDVADRKKLLDCGDPLPGDGPYTIYRGVGDGSEKAAVRRFSWTSSPGTAAWFAVAAADRLKLTDPSVFELTVKKDHIIAYTDERDEKEFIIRMYPQARPTRMETIPEPVKPATE